MHLLAGSHKNLPRLLTEDSGQALKALKGVHLVWPDLSRSAVFDIGVSGLSVKSVSEFGKIKVGATKQVRIEIPGINDFINLNLKIAKQSGHNLGLHFESITSDGRLVLPQALKDQLAAENMQSHTTETLFPNLRADLWLHGPYDTNILIWREGTEIVQAMLEYDNLLWTFERGEVSLQKSQNLFSESRGYFGSKATAPVAMGASWPDRLLKLLTQVEKNHPEAAGIQALFKTERS
jgi:hypothetical protein